jgi:hypothetical protein
MPRKPYPVKRARKLLEEWLSLRVAKSTPDAPITVAAAVAYLVAKKIPTHRDTMHVHGLSALVAVAARRQAEVGGRPPNERNEHQKKVDELRAQNERLQNENRELLGLIATILYNARLHNVSEAELRQEMPKTDRSVSRAGRGSRQLD